ncbi:MAG TPA: M28 family peptidase [Kofleriaceae bacterium]|nr:M28 family peptidase [Kofleriaceae bacterium]
MIARRAVAAAALAGAVWGAVGGAAGGAAACGGDDAPGMPDAPGGPDARPDAPPGCTRPDLEASWLRPLLSDAVAGLAATPRFLTQDRDAARTFLAGQLTAMGWTAELQLYPGGINVHATIPATLPGGAAVVVGAHFDTVDQSPGANDNASGAAVVLAVARYLRDVPCRTAPVIVALFDQEETGLFGSRAFAQMLDPAAVRAVHTIDQVAWDADGDRRFEIEQPTAQLAAEWRAAAAVVGASVAATPTGGTDHDSFRARGFPAVGLTEEYVGGDTSPWRHTAQDTPASIAPYLEYMALAAKLTAQVVMDEAAP